MLVIDQQRFVEFPCTITLLGSFLLTQCSLCLEDSQNQVFSLLWLKPHVGMEQQCS